MSREFLFIGSLLLQSVVICAVFVALVDLSKKIFGCDDFLTFCIAVLALGVLGFLSFWFAYVNYLLFTIVKIVVLVSLLIHCGLLVFRRKPVAGWLAEPLLYTFLFFAIVITLGFASGGLEFPDKTAALRFSHELPIDNIIPLMLANALKTGHIPSPLIGATLSSDRPPLQAGLYLFLVLRNSSLGYQIVACWLQATFLFGVWGLFVAAGVPTAARRLVLLACCLLPTAIINTFYVWPKMVAVTYLLLVFALLFCHAPKNRAEERIVGVLMGGLAALAVLSHGTALFALLGFSLTILIFWAWPSLTTVIYGAIAALLLYAPWLGYQKFIDPPGNLLLKWHLAGVTHVDKRGLVEALLDSYSTRTWDSYVQGRFANLNVMIANWPHNFDGLAKVTLSWNPKLAAMLRGSDFFNFLPSLHAFSIALICAILLLPFMNGALSQYRLVILRLLAALGFTCLVFIVIIFIPGQTINHQGTYAIQVIATIAAMLVLSLRAPLLAVLFLVAQTITVVTLYGFTLSYDWAFWPMLAICVAGTMTLFIYSLFPIVSDFLRRKIMPTTA